MFKFVEVFLYGLKAGVLAEDDNGDISFEYEQDYLKNGYSISPQHLPLNPGSVGFKQLKRKESFKGLPGVFADSLPDRFGTTVLEQHFNTLGIPSSNIPIFAKILYIGRNGMGALEYSPEVPHDIPLNEELEIASLRMEARRVLQGKIENSTAQIFRYGATAGGARAKAIILYDKNTKQFKSPFVSQRGESFEHWLLKFDGVVSENPELSDSMPWERTEYIYNCMAKNAGLNVPEIDYIEESGRFHFLVKRFDRDGDKKIHMHTLGGLLHNDLHDQRSMTYEYFLNLTNTLTQDNEQTREAFKRVVFNVLSSNLDDHVKNQSYLMNEKGEWSLSPYYDIIYASKAHEWFARGHQMTIKGKAKNFSRDDLIKLGASSSIRRSDLIIDEVINSLGDWESLSLEYGIAKMYPEHHEMVKNDLANLRKKIAPAVLPVSTEQKKQMGQSIVSSEYECPICQSPTAKKKVKACTKCWKNGSAKTRHKT